MGRVCGGVIIGPTPSSPAERLASQAWGDGTQTDSRASERAWRACDRQTWHLCRFPRLEAFKRGNNGSALHGLENPADCGGWFMAHPNQGCCRNPIPEAGLTLGKKKKTRRKACEKAISKIS